MYPPNLDPLGYADFDRSTPEQQRLVRESPLVRIRKMKLFGNPLGAVWCGHRLYKDCVGKVRATLRAEVVR